MAKSPAHWEMPASNKGSAAQEQQQLKPGKAGLSVPRDSDWIRAAKDQGTGFSGNATAVYRYADNPAAGEYRRPPEHRYDTLPYGGDSGAERTAVQNRQCTNERFGVYRAKWFLWCADTLQRALSP